MYKKFRTQIVKRMAQEHRILKIQKLCTFLFEYQNQKCVTKQKYSSALYKMLDLRKACEVRGLNENIILISW